VALKRIPQKTVIAMTIKSTLLKAADAVEHITQDDVLDAQAKLLAEGMPLEKVAKIDRADIAVAHLRMCAEGEFD